MNHTQGLNYSYKPLGFDSKSKAINYYKYEQKHPGNVCKYLIAKLFT